MDLEWSREENISIIIDFNSDRLVIWELAKNPTLKKSPAPGRLEPKKSQMATDAKMQRYTLIRPQTNKLVKANLYSRCLSSGNAYERQIPIWKENRQLKSSEQTGHHVPLKISVANLTQTP